MAEINRFKVSICYSQNTRNSLKYFGVKFAEFNAWNSILLQERETLVKNKQSSHTKAANDKGLFTTYRTLEKPLHLFEACLLRKLPINQLTANQSPAKTFLSRQKSTETEA